VPAIKDIPGVKVHGKGKKEFVLPVGYVDAAGTVHNHMVLREMKGTEDDIMGDDELPFGERVTAILANCCERLGDITDKEIIKKALADELETGLPLTEQDRTAAMIFLRRVTVGDNYKFSRTCIRCGQRARNRSINLSTLQIEKTVDAKQRKVKIQLPRSGTEAILSVLTAKAAAEVGKLKPTGRDAKSLAIMTRLESLGGEPLGNDGSALQKVKDLPQADRNVLRQTWVAMEAKVDTDVEVTCTNPICGTTWSFPLDVGQAFFLDLEGTVEPTELTWL